MRAFILLLLGLCSCRPEPAVLFSTARDGNWEVYRWQADARLNLSAYPAVDRDPDGHPQQPWVVFTSTRDNNPNLYVVDREGNNLTRVTDSPYPERQPRWSPDGRQLVYVSEVADKDEELYLTAYPGTGNPQRLTQSPMPDYDPAWAVDGQSLFFTSERDGNGEIYRLHLADKRLERLTQHVARDSHPAPAPDGKQLVFVSDRDGDPELYLLTLATGALRRLTTHIGLDTEPTWESSEHLLYASQQGNDTQIMRLDLKSGATTPVTELGTAARQPRLWRNSARRQG